MNARDGFALKDGKNFEIKIHSNFDFGRSDINSRDVPVSYTLEDGTVKNTIIHVIKK
jgi:hypothetical protein